MFRRPMPHDDDPKMFGRYGVRVPALIVSPWVEPASVSHTLFDHTSIIKTILLRFCAADLEHRDRRERLSAWLRAGHPRYMGTRVAHANDLGELLANATPRPAPAHHGLIADAAARAAEPRHPAPINMNPIRSRRRSGKSTSPPRPAC